MASTSHWLVLVASIWLQACSGTGYLFGSISPVIKTTLDFNQKQLNRLGVAKDIGDSGGLLAGFLCDWLPPWGLILVGTLQNLIGYGWLWLIVIGRVPQPPFIVVCCLVFGLFSRQCVLSDRKSRVCSLLKHSCLGQQTICQFDVADYQSNESF